MDVYSVISKFFDLEVHKPLDIIVGDNNITPDFNTIVLGLRMSSKDYYYLLGRFSTKYQASINSKYILIQKNMGYTNIVKIYIVPDIYYGKNNEGLILSQTREQLIKNYKTYPYNKLKLLNIKNLGIEVPDEVLSTPVASSNVFSA